MPIWCQNSADRLRGPPFVVVEDSAQPFMALNSGIHIDHAVLFLDQPIVESLMIPLGVIVLRVFLHRVPQMPLAQRDDLGKTLGFDRTNESLRMRVQVWASRGKHHWFDPRGFQDLAKRPREQWIAVVDEIARTIQEPIFGIGEITRDLAHPGSIGSGKNPRDLDPPGLEVDDEENEISNQTGPSNHFDTEEVGRRNTRKRCFLPPNAPSGTSSTTFPSS